MRDLTPGASSRHGCGQPGHGEELLETAGFDRFEIQALDVMRLIFAAQSDQRPRHGATPEQVAKASFGAESGPVLLVALTAFIQTMALSRAERFRYSNPYCVGCARILTRHEAGLLRILHHLRRGRGGPAMVQALMLCEARPVAALLEAAEDLAQLSPAVAV